MKATDITKYIQERFGRYVVATFLKGSRNYGLNTENSDYDWSVFVMPTMTELYRGDADSSVTTEFSGEMNGERFEGIMYDIRRLIRLTRQANPAFLEIYYSKDMDLSGMSKDVRAYFEREDIRYNLTHENMLKFYYSTLGVIAYEIKHSERGNVDLVEQYGFNTKKIMHAIRFCQLLVDYADPAKNLGDCLRQTSEERRQHLLDIRYGKFTEEEALKELDALYKIVNSPELKAEYEAFKPRDIDETIWLDTYIRECMFKNKEVWKALYILPLYR